MGGFTLILPDLLEPVRAAIATAAPADPVIWRFLGRLHPLVVHFPIALILVAALVECVLAFRRGHRISQVGMICLTLGAVSAGIAAWFGWLNAAHEPHGAAVAETITLHRWSGILAASLAGVALLLGLGSRFMRGRRPVAWFRAALIMSATCTVIGGHFGGELVYGRGYLLAVLRTPEPAVVEAGDAEPTAAPDESEPVHAVTAGAGGGAVLDFSADVAPIFAEHCGHCHGADRQRGRLRLDRIADVFEGDPASWVIRPGDPAGSVLVQRIGRPAGDPDLMPADGDPLPPAKIETIERWIAAGAPFASPARAAEDADPPAEPSASPDETATEQSTLDVEARAARQRAIDALHERGAIAVPIAAGRDEIEVNLSLLDPPFTDEELSLLDGLEGYLLRLNLARSAITDAGLAQLSGHDRLEHLRLDGTSITDAGLSSLSELSSVTDLNLRGTAISDDGLETLARLPSLQRVHLWQTAVTDAGAARLAESRPDLEVTVGSTLDVGAITP